VVVDLVPFFVEQNEYAHGVVPQVNALATALRDAGGTVAWVVPGPSRRTAVDREFYGDEVAAAYAASGGSGPVGERLWHELDVRDATDLLVEKSAPSAFFPGRSPLPGLLSERGIDTVVVTGTVTNVCCESTVRDASTLGYRVVLVADGCAARNYQDHNASLHVVYRSFGDVRPTADVLDLIGS
jgi:nicotinamidase-related amidase